MAGLFDPLIEKVIKENHAYVSIVNKSGRPITYAAVGHKYSDTYTSRMSFLGPIAPEEETIVDKNVHKVTYNTGVGTPGKDRPQRVRLPSC